MIRVLFVCLGNICRSPMAEAIFRHYVKEAGLEEEIYIDSAGTGDWCVGDIPHIGTRSKLKTAGISYDGITARQVAPSDFTYFDYIVAMDNSNVENLNRLAGKKIAHLFRLVDFIPNTSYQGVPDPYFTGDFDEAFGLISVGCQEFLQHILLENQLQQA